MLKITIPATEMYDEANDEFVTVEEQTLELEHSLVSLSKWEAKWCKPFLTKDQKTVEETIDYIQCMTLTPDVDPDVYRFIPMYPTLMKEINEYIAAPMTATWFSDAQKRGKASGEQTTSELIYYWMVALTIPFECQHWHLNRLLTLVQVCNLKNQPSKKMSKRDILTRNKALNDARRQQLNSKG